MTVGLALDDSGSVVTLGLGCATAADRGWIGDYHPKVDRQRFGVGRIGGFTLDALAQLATGC